MSIADKLTYLQTTKQLLKTEINKINNVLTDNSTFRSYPQELFNGYLDILNNGTDTLWNNLEKVSQTGTEAVLENVETAPIKMVLNGNTSQETTTGKNIFNYTRTTKTITTNGVTSTINDDGSITLDGTATALTWFVLNSASNWESGDYTMYLTDNEIVGLLLYSDVGVTGTIKQINVPTTITKNIALRIESGTTFNNLTIFPMILKGKYTLENIGDYEPYTGGQPSPSPDYPQEVKVVKGENVVSVQGKNLFNNVVFKDSNIINANGEETYNSLGCIWEKIKVKPNTTYTLSYTSTDYSFSQRISEYDSNNTFIQRNLTNSTPYTFTTNANTEYINLSGLKTDTNIMIEQNSQATPYVPYSKTDYPINLGDIELCKINTYKDYFHKDSGKWYVHKEIGKVVLDGTENWSATDTQTTGYSRFASSILKGAILPPSSNDDAVLAYCNAFETISGNNTYRRHNGIGCRTLGRYIDVYYDQLAEGTAEDFKTWLSNNNVTLYYVLATPTEEEITDTTLIEQLEAISKAKSVKDKTYITQTNDELPFILDVEAIKEYSVE